MAEVVFGKANVVSTTEHRSTKCCAACGDVLRLMRAAAYSRRHLKRHAKKVALFEKGLRVEPRKLPVLPPILHDVRMCGNKLCPDAQRSIVGRDTNAALNIRAAYIAVSAADAWGSTPEDKVARQLAFPLHMRFKCDERPADPPAMQPCRMKLPPPGGGYPKMPYLSYEGMMPRWDALYPEDLRLRPSESNTRYAVRRAARSDLRAANRVAREAAVLAARTAARRCSWCSQFNARWRRHAARAAARAAADAAARAAAAAARATAAGGF